MSVQALWRPFGFAPGGGAEAFAVAQVALSRHDPSLSPYLFALQRHVSFEPAASTASSGPRRLFRHAIDAGRILDGWIARLPRRRLDVDVLLCGVWQWERPAEIRLWETVVNHVLQSGRNAAVLVHGGSESARRLSERHPDEIASGRLRLVDPRGLAGRAADRLDAARAWNQARGDFETARTVLREEGVHLADEAFETFAWIAARSEEWRLWADRIDFRSALVRCHWLPLGRDVAETGLERGIPTASLQQGVVSHSMDAPLTVHRMGVFGAPSAELLEQLDAEFSHSTGRVRTCTDFLPGGPFLDSPVSLGSPTPGLVLALDQAQPWALDYYDLHRAQEDLVEALDALLHRAPRARIRLRRHPAAAGTTAWHDLFESHPGRIETSAADMPLARDLEDAAAAVTLFSGAGVSALACGRPVYFHTPPGGFASPDLASLSPLRTESPGELTDRLAAVLADEDARLGELEHVSALADTYFGGHGSNDWLERGVLGQLLAPV